MIFFLSNKPSGSSGSSQGFSGSTSGSSMVPVVPFPGFSGSGSPDPWGGITGTGQGTTESLGEPLEEPLIPCGEPLEQLKSHWRNH